MSVKVVITGDLFDEIDTLFPGFSGVVLGGDLDDEMLDRLTASRHEKPREWVDVLETLLDALADVIHTLVDEDQFDAARQVCRIATNVDKDLATMQKIVPINDLEA